MNVLIGTDRVSLDPKKLLGEGGEASVLSIRQGRVSRAVKLYHAPTSGRARKLEALLAIAHRLSAEVLAPRDLVRDPGTGEVIGFVMDCLDRGFVPLALLMKRPQWAALGMNLSAALRVLEAVRSVLVRLHRSGVVVGDLNDQNELFSPSGKRVAFVDVDSFQLPGFSCDVATEAYLDPRLYGPDPAQPCLTGGGVPRRFDEASDWYALAVLAFRVITGVHPFGGVTISNASLARRALAGETVLAASVHVPDAIRDRLRALPAWATAYFERVFARGERLALPEGALDAWSHDIAACACGLELTRGTPCPRCTTKASPVRGGAEEVEALRVLVTNGVIVALAGSAAALVAVAREDGTLVLYRKQGNVLERAVLRSSGDAELVAASNELVAIATTEEDGAVISVFDATTGEPLPATTTDLAFGSPSLAVVGDTIYRLAGASLLATRPRSVEERLLTTVVPGQTRLSAAPGGVVGVTTVLGRRDVFRMYGRERVDLLTEPLRAGERIVDEAIVANESETLLTLLVRAQGRDTLREELFDRRGARRAIRSLDPAARLAGTAIANALLAGTERLVATDRGLYRERVDTAGAARLFESTSPYVAHEALLCPSQGGLSVASGGTVTLLRIRPSHERNNP